MGKKKSLDEKMAENDQFADELGEWLSKRVDARIETLDEMDANMSYTSSGNWALNFVLSGSLKVGFVLSRILALIGLSGNGKSLQSTRMAYEHLKKSPDNISFIIDVERGMVKSFVHSIAGNDTETANRIRIVKNIVTLEDLKIWLKRLVAFQESKKSKREILVVIDSWSSLSSEHELELTEKEEKKADMTKAKVARELFRSLNQSFEDNKITVCAIMHITEKIGVMFGNPQTPTSHGSALIYYASTILELLTTEEIVNERGIVLGQRLTFKGKKNRVTYKGKSATVSYYFVGKKPGLDPLSGLPDLLYNWYVLEDAVKDKEDKKEKKKALDTLKDAEKEGKAKKVKAEKDKSKKFLLPETMELQFTDDDGKVWKFTKKTFENFIQEFGEEKFIDIADRRLQAVLKDEDDAGKLMASMASEKSEEDMTDEELDALALAELEEEE